MSVELGQVDQAHDGGATLTCAYRSGEEPGRLFVVTIGIALWFVFGHIYLRNDSGRPDAYAKST